MNSGKELEDLYLKPLGPLGIERKDCWITDLVKVFLFKEGHIRKYQSLQKDHVAESRHRFKEYAERSLEGFLYQEINLAGPTAILLLGSEVTSVMLKCSEKKAIEMMKPEPVSKKVDGTSYAFAPLPHPGIVMKKTERGHHWKERLRNDLIPALKVYLQTTK